MLIPFHPNTVYPKRGEPIYDSGLFDRYNIRPKGVLHIGANVGEEAPIYEQLGIKKQIWIEGNPEIFLKLKANIAHNPEAIALNYLIGDEEKEVTFHIANNGGQSSSVLELGTHATQHPDVHFVRDIQAKMYRIDGLGLDLEGVDFINIDLQGFEMQALKGMGDLLNGFKWAYLEVNRADVYKGCAQIESMDLFMLANGFRRVETRWILNWGDALYVR